MNIFNLELHQTIDIEPHHLTVTRVPGGWIYKFSSFMDHQGINISTCFVPHSDEFYQEEMSKNNGRLD